MQDIPLEKVRVGDINIAYKVFGKRRFAEVKELYPS